jgi:hypothetical protein
MEKRADAELLIKKVLQEKSFLVLTQADKLLIIDAYDDEMRIESVNYEEYLLLDESEKLNNILVLVLKDYLGSWHVSSEEMKEISDYIQSISKN